MTIAGSRFGLKFKYILKWPQFENQVSTFAIFLRVDERKLLLDERMPLFYKKSHLRVPFSQTLRLAD